jgi:hypothetical protein
MGTTETGTGVQGLASSSGGTALSGFTGDPGAIPIVAQGDTGQTANLQEWRDGSGTALSVVNASGWLGIGTASPQSVFHVNDTGPATTGPMIQADSNNSGGKTPRIGFIDTALGSITTAPIWFYDQYQDLFRIFRQPNINTDGRVMFVITNTGLVGYGGINPPSHLIHLAGGAYCDGTGAWIAGSSVRWKENIEPLTDSIDTLKQLHPVAYNRKETPNKTTMGFIAEEVGKVLPTVVDWDKAEPGYAEGYDHLAILALAVQAVKELATRNSKQQTEIDALRLEIKQLGQTLKRLVAS